MSRTFPDTRMTGDPAPLLPDDGLCDEDTCGEDLALPRAALRMRCVPPGHPGRARAERYVRDAYLAAFGARLGELAPGLRMLLDADGSVVAAFGLRCAGDGPLFAEQYLDAPIERWSGGPRSAVAEVGNFAARRPGDMRRCTLALAELLCLLGYRWALFVATRTLRNALGRLALPYRVLGPATADRLARPGDDAWGRYYLHAPEVVLGDLEDGCARLRPASVRIASLGVGIA